jgi:hypothetical protein
MAPDVRSPVSYDQLGSAQIVMVATDRGYNHWHKPCDQPMPSCLRRVTTTVARMSSGARLIGGGGLT